MPKCPVAVVGVLLLLVPGCFVNHEKRVRQRAEQLLAFLCADDMDGCVSLTDPVYVRAQGSDKVKIRFKLMYAITRLGQLEREDLRIDRVTVGDDKKSADVFVSMRKGDDWESLAPSHWVRADGQWYVRF